MAKVYNNILELIGNTPLIKLNKVLAKGPGTFYAKLECFNPGNSAKDRIALNIIEKAEKEGKIKQGATIVETTSGNTGFAIAMICRVKGYKCIVAVSDKTKADKVAFLKSMGAEVHMCLANVAPEDPKSYYEVARRIAGETPNSIYINQYFNKQNTEAHYLTTGPEIWEQTEGKVTHVIACTGTGGTLSGAAKYLKEKNPNIKVIGIDAKGSILKTYNDTGEIDESEIAPYQIEGLGKNLIPGALDFSVIDEYVRVEDEESAYAVRELALEEGMMLGYTSGACLVGTRKILNQLDKDSVVVMIMPDHGSRYMSKVYSDTWMKEQGFTNSEYYTLSSDDKVHYIEK